MVQLINSILQFYACSAGDLLLSKLRIEVWTDNLRMRKTFVHYVNCAVILTPRYILICLFLPSCRTTENVSKKGMKKTVPTCRVSILYCKLNDT